MLASHLASDNRQAVADSFILVALPAVALAVRSLVGRFGAETPLTWKHRLAGAAVLLASVGFGLGFLG